MLFSDKREKYSNVFTDKSDKRKLVNSFFKPADTIFINLHCALLPILDTDKPLSIAGRIELMNSNFDI
jgi:hypothetical protein